MTIEKLLDRKGPLGEIIPLFKEGTWKEAIDITNDRRENLGLRDMWIWTANLPLYTIEENQEFLYFGRKASFSKLIVQHIKEATAQLISNHNYRPICDYKQDILESVKSGDTIKIKLSDILKNKEPEEYGDELDYFEIDTSNYNEKLNPAQKELVERVYGSDEIKEGEKTSDLEKNMNILREKSINKTKIYVLKPEYIRKNVKGGSAIVRVCCMSRFDLDSAFYAAIRNVDLPYATMRGVLKITKNNYGTIANKFNDPGLDPQILGDMLNSQGAENISKILTTYFSIQEKNKTSKPA